MLASFLIIYFWLCGVFVAVQAFSSCGQSGMLSCGRELLVAVVSCCRAHFLGGRASVVAAHGPSCCGTPAQVLHSMRNPPPGTEIKPVSPALAGGLLSTAPPMKSYMLASAFRMDTPDSRETFSRNSIS